MSIFAGTQDGTNWGFYLEPKGLVKYFELTNEEHIALMDGQGEGKVIVFHEDKKPTLEDPPPPTEEEVARNRIMELKYYLSETDYVTIKIAEGVISKEECEDTLKKRTEARAEINKLEVQFPNIK